MIFSRRAEWCTRPFCAPRRPPHPPGRGQPPFCRQGRPVEPARRSHRTCNDSVVLPACGAMP